VSIGEGKGGGGSNFQTWKLEIPLAKGIFPPSKPFPPPALFDIPKRNLPPFSSSSYHTTLFILVGSGTLGTLARVSFFHCFPFFFTPSFSLFTSLEPCCPLHPHPRRLILGLCATALTRPPRPRTARLRQVITSWTPRRLAVPYHPPPASLARSPLRPPPPHPPVR